MLPLRPSSSGQPFQLLHRLPSELLQNILTHLSNTDLGNLNLASTWCYDLATPLIWREVTLTDRTTHHGISEDDKDDQHDDTPLLRKLLLLAAKPRLAGYVQVLEHRCHLPPPSIFSELPRTPFSGQTLSFDPRTVELVRRAVRGMVRCVTLRIVFGHAALTETLLRCFFERGRVRETPARRLWLEGCRLAAGCDLDVQQHPWNLPRELDFDGLESVRLRRLPMRPAWTHGEKPPGNDFVHARGCWVSNMNDGEGGSYAADCINALGSWYSAQGDSLLIGPGIRMETAKPLILSLFTKAMAWDDAIVDKLEEDSGRLFPNDLPEVKSMSYEDRAVLAWQGPLLDPTRSDLRSLSTEMQRLQHERMPTPSVAMNMFHSASSTLTSLNLDWVLTLPYNLAISLGRDNSKFVLWLETFASLFALRFPRLRAFQYRNAVSMDTLLPPGLFLLDHAKPKFRNTTLTKMQLSKELSARLDLASLEFMEYHAPRLQCLAFPMESFCPAAGPSADVASRVDAVINHLSRNLVDLRIDNLYDPAGEPHTDPALHDTVPRDRRRAFISHVASRMRKLTQIKIEGGIPRDERREMLRALRHCPLEKVVLIGVCSAIGNTWGAEGRDLQGLPEAVALLEDLATEGGFGEIGGVIARQPTLPGEYEDAVRRVAYTPPSAVQADGDFAPEFGWSTTQPPLLHTLATLPFAETLQSLKLCGYKGAPILFSPTPVTSALLAPLRQFHALRELTIGMCLLTGFEGAGRDGEVIRYWKDRRDPGTTALALAPVRQENGEEDLSEENAWARQLRTRFAPEALAGEVCRLLGPHLSDEAKERRNDMAKREGGVWVRVSMSIGDWGGIFDMDLRIGNEDGPGTRNVWWDLEGPRGEMEPKRRRAKMVERRWF